MVKVFPRRCYILKETEKAYIVRPEYQSSDIEELNNYTFIIPKKAVTQFDIIGYSENHFEVRDIDIRFWWRDKISEQYDKQVEKYLEEGFWYECKYSGRYRCKEHGCKKNKDCKCPENCKTVKLTKKLRKNRLKKKVN